MAIPNARPRIRQRRDYCEINAAEPQSFMSQDLIYQMVVAMYRSDLRKKRLVREMNESAMATDASETKNIVIMNERQARLIVAVVFVNDDRDHFMARTVDVHEFIGDAIWHL
jgi:EAL domain-containing protein (putative c-di-GMP-specific phosphodiesterase class I)